MNHTARLFLISAFLVATSVAALAEPPRPVIAGGWQARGVDKDVKTVADFAVKAIKKPGAKLASIESAESQVVAGMNYRVKFTLSDKSRWDATVWRRLDNKMQVTALAEIMPPLPAMTVISVKGTVMSVDDGGYPMFGVAIKTDSGAALDLSANAEDMDRGDNTLDSFKGKKVVITYTVTDEPDLMDMRLNNNSLMASDGSYTRDPAWKTVTGKLGGASEVSGGDLPDKITVTAPNGQKMVFEYFVDETMVSANGKTVTAWYGMRREKRLTKIRSR